MLSVQGVGKVYGEGERAYVALDGVEIEIADGEFVCLLGASGCGKSTLLNILAGFEPVTAGRVALNGRPIAKPGPDRMMFFQDAGAALFPWLTAAENVDFGLRLRGVPRAERRPAIDRVLALVNLAEHRDKVPAQMSGGMRQRLQIARALAIEPDVLLMDEPFAALDALTRRRMHHELLRVWQATRKMVVFVTHDIAEAITLADRVAVMSVGPRARIAEILPVELPRPRSPADAGFGRLYARIEAMIAGDAAEAA